MKNLLLTLLVLSILFTIGCEDDDVSDSNPLVGVYNLVSYSISGDGVSVNQDADSNNNLFFILADDGIYSYDGGLEGNTITDSGTWAATGSKLTFIYEDNGETLTDIWDYTLSGDNLTMIMSGLNQTFTYNWDKE